MMYAAFKQLNWKHFIVLSAGWGKTMMNEFKLMALPPTVINYMANGADPLKGAAQQISQFVETTGASVFLLLLSFWDQSLQTLKDANQLGAGKSYLVLFMNTPAVNPLYAKGFMCAHEELDSGYKTWWDSKPGIIIVPPRYRHCTITITVLVTAPSLQLSRRLRSFRHLVRRGNL